ncbi:unnamed protein product [Amoebophrya sp. A25]|nr:unnamed protein product [Amoebophrya sp. A25]|eukprot:GSA25T00014858001.1
MTGFAHKFRFSHITLPVSFVLSALWVWWTLHRAQQLCWNIFFRNIMMDALRNITGHSMLVGFVGFCTLFQTTWYRSIAAGYLSMSHHYDRYAIVNKHQPFALSAYITIAIDRKLEYEAHFYSFAKLHTLTQRREKAGSGGSGMYNRGTSGDSPEGLERKAKTQHVWTVEPGHGQIVQTGDLVSITLESLLDAQSGEEMTLQDADRRQSFKLARSSSQMCKRVQGRRYHLGCMPKVSEILDGMRLGESRKILTKDLPLESGNRSTAILRIRLEDVTSVSTLFADSETKLEDDEVDEDL